jgi:hypothetical protein
MGVGGYIVGNIQCVQTVHTDEKYVLNLLTAAKLIVGAAWYRKSGTDQSDRQGYY